MTIDSFLLVIGLSFTVCAAAIAQTSAETGSQTQLKSAEQTRSAIRFSTVIGWPKVPTPKAPPGFNVSLFAEGFKSPRQLYQAPNGDIYLSEANTELKAEGFKKLLSWVLSLSNG